MRGMGIHASMLRAVESTERATKICPDCAEEVLLAARKCRFCGYRFDTAPAPSPTGSHGVLDLIRRPKRKLTVREQIAEWGIALAPGEQVEMLDLCQIEGESGFAILTDRRLMFVPSPNPTQRSYDTFWIGEFTGVTVRRRRLRPSELALDTLSSRVVLQGLTASQLARLGAALASRVG
jgi:hypothetical protein